MRRRTLPLAIFFSASLVASQGARAQEESAPRAVPNESLPKPRPSAPDLRSGRPTLALSVGPSWLWGSFEAGNTQASLVGLGVAPGFQFALPFRRHFAVEAWGKIGFYDGTSDKCPGCNTTRFAGGLAVSYHLLEGVPLDPWFSAGVGYNRTHLSRNDAPGGRRSVDYDGIDALRLAFGADYYPAPVFGFGPYLDGSVGRYVNRSPNTPNSLGVNGTFSFGVRFVFSPFR